MKLTPAACRTAPIGSTLRDHEVTGLELRVRATKRSWHIYYRARGVERRPKLGEFPAMSLNAARSAARDLLQAVARGDDPSQERRAARAAPTVNELADAFLDYNRRRVAATTFTSYEGYVRTRVRPMLGRRRVAEVERPDIDRMIWTIERDHGPSEANHVRTVLAMMFNRARDTFRMVPGDHINPVAGSHRAEETQRTRLASPEELAAVFRIMSELQSEKPAHVAAVTCLFLTGMRPGEVEGAECRHWLGDRFVIDRHKTSKRTGALKVHYVHPAAAAMVAALPSAQGKPGDLLFGGIKLAGFWRRVRKAAGCPDLQLRDARRTFASYGITEDADLDRISQLLGHTQRQTTLRYAHLLTDKRAALTTQIADRLLAVSRGEV